ncbi:MAG: CAP domain-containing protein [Myxococcales bacterium]
MRPVAPLFALCLILPALPAFAGELEREIEEALARAYRAAGAQPPRPDKDLALAAVRLAERALRDGVREAVDVEACAEELSRVGAWDPPPRTVAVRASPPARAASALAGRSDLAATPATHFGLGIATKDGAAAAVLLLSSRRALLDPFPRKVEVGASETLSGKLAFPLHDARVFVTAPGGDAGAVATEGKGRNTFRADLHFPSPGLYTVEVVAESIKGPEVAALFRVRAGEARGGAIAKAAEVAERDDLERATAQVLEALSARRRSHGLRPLARSALLDSVAEAHAAEMVRFGYFAHVSPISGDVGNRLKQAGFAFARVTENLGEAETALAAHRLIEASPGHLANMIDPEVDLVGLGAAKVRRGSLENVVLVEVFARRQP